MKHIYKQECIEGVILVDAENAFNELKRQVALHNILCLNFSTVLVNTYRRPSQLFISGGEETPSTEGTPQ